jgi:hypothetical protein
MGRVSARSRLFWCSYWTCYALLIGIVLAALPMGWPIWVADVAVVAAFTISVPSIVYRLTGGRSAAWFARLNHRLWWSGVYLATCVAVSAPRLGLPTIVPLLTGSAAFAAVVWLLVGKRPLLVPKNR